MVDLEVVYHANHSYVAVVAAAGTLTPSVHLYSFTHPVPSVGAVAVVAATYLYPDNGHSR